MADVLIVNEQEAIELARMPTRRRLGRCGAAADRARATTVILTLGARGALVTLEGTTTVIANHRSRCGRHHRRWRCVLWRVYGVLADGMTAVEAAARAVVAGSLAVTTRRSATIDCHTIGNRERLRVHLTCGFTFGHLEAEGVGFEPTRRHYRLRDFQSRALGQTMRPFRDLASLQFGWRRGRDSNPRWLNTTPIFEIGTLNRSDTSPGQF